ncbi:lysophospholipid acyltransferase family protein [Opitutus sp. ER46]|uniref:lysophospholipid acyltransferase family protein n=1 Tax=Opitutus sp. ER46 TaxID=2161864 RepID=UPI000D3283CF|nr:lysophospholipid acyltransferase family protein [Opitutus sp. ER46]PTY00686.1 hypothetical protein DB354_01105 [Opitutus sp. ER46]
MIGRVYWAGWYYACLLVFAVGGLALNLVYLVLGAGPATPRTERWFRHGLCRAVRAYFWLLRVTGVCRLRGREALAAVPAGTVVVANHRCLLDSVALLEPQPEAVCIFRPGSGRLAIIGACGLRSGYLFSSGGVDTVRAAIAKVAAGHTLVVFPEGTRTPAGQVLGPLRPGFAVIAERVRAPIQVVRIRTNSEALTKGCPFWRLPRVPFEYVVELGPRLAPDAAGTYWEAGRGVRVGSGPEALTRYVERALRGGAAPMAPGEGDKV